MVMVWWELIIWGIIVMPVHEWGHAWVAKKRGIFDKYVWTGMGPAVKLTRPFPKKNDYMSGIYASILTLPIWLLFGGNILGFLIFILALGFFDISLITSWVQVQEEIELYEEVQWYREHFSDRYRTLVREEKPL